MKQGYCDICDDDTELTKVDGMWLCEDCEDDYWRIDFPDPRFFWILRNVGMNMLSPEPRHWDFSYDYIFMDKVVWTLEFKLTEWQYKIYESFWMPYWKFKMAMNIRKRRKNGKR